MLGAGSSLPLSGSATGGRRTTPPVKWSNCTAPHSNSSPRLAQEAPWRSGASLFLLALSRTIPRYAAPLSQCGVALLFKCRRRSGGAPLLRIRARPRRSTRTTRPTSWLS
ncbi:hypothetical protein NDU88_007337 [Pleurodeles waltl]|uniref:Uncharacterized protein n=1 Tax=Pleurodeles waltl TaxID=8319 RepID=A0AAV7N1T8_PLEWA|nr:hypothetical protein NDU88_007337 [Pleurodeles waltl]